MRKVKVMLLILAGLVVAMFLIVIVKRNRNDVNKEFEEYLSAYSETTNEGSTDELPSANSSRPNDIGSENFWDNEYLKETRFRLDEEGELYILSDKDEDVYLVPTEDEILERVKEDQNAIRLRMSPEHPDYNEVFEICEEKLDTVFEVQDVEYEVEENVHIIYTVSFKNTDMIALFSTTMSENGEECVIYETAMNKYSSDYPLLYFVNGVPDDAKVVYLKWMETESPSGRMRVGETEYISGDDECIMKDRTGNTFIIRMKGR